MKIDRLEVPFPDIRAIDGDRAATLAHLSLRLKTCRFLLGRLFPGAEGRTLLDLGSGPGNFARLAARHGFAVTGLDVREPWELNLGTAAGPPREYAFMRGDLRDFDGFAAFDVIACIGVLYHLPLDDQLDLLKRCRGKPMIIDTEVYDGAMIAATDRHRFTPLRTDQGYDGALCAEKTEVYSSMGNRHSFWFDEASLLRAIADSGRERVTLLDPAYHSAFGPRRWIVLHD